MIKKVKLNMNNLDGFDFKFICVFLVKIFKKLKILMKKGKE